MTEDKGSRRRFLSMFVGAAAATRGLAGCSSGGVGPQSVGDVPAGAASSFAVGDLRQVGGEPVCVARDSGGVYAMTLTCTHAGCQASVVGPTVDCPCHGSTFDRNGNVTGGPAPAPLDHFAVSADAAGAMTVHTGTIVDSGTRLVV
jgi:Rieske Fe-S protein